MAVTLVLARSALSVPEQGIAAARNKHRYLLGCKRDNHCVSNLAWCWCLVKVSLGKSWGCCSVSQGVCTYPQGCDFSHLIPAIFGASSTPSTLALLETQWYFYRGIEPRGLLSAEKEFQLWKVSNKWLRRACGVSERCSELSRAGVGLPVILSHLLTFPKWN